MPIGLYDIVYFVLYKKMVSVCKDGRQPTFTTKNTDPNEYSSPLPGDIELLPRGDQNPGSMSTGLCHHIPSLFGVFRASNLENRIQGLKI